MNSTTIFQLLEGGDVLTYAILFLTLLVGGVLGHAIRKAPRSRKPRTHMELQQDFLQRVRALSQEATDTRTLQIRLEQLQIAFRTLHGFNPMEPLPPEE